jgi:GntR family transcriptional regulator, galactonate operon transcriptional repressor
MASSIRAFTGRNHQLAAEIGRRIVSGKYPPGSVLPPEAQLLAEFGLSRPVLREAIKLLESKGMLEARQRVGTTITERNGWNMLDADVLGWIAQSGADPEMLIRLTDVRMIVEPGACLLAARDGSDEAIGKIAEADQRMVTHVDDPHLFVQADRDFHLALMAACGNEYLAAVGTAISAALTVSLHRMNPIPVSNRGSLLLHKPVVDALKKRDGEAAARASRRQLDDAFRRLRSEEPAKKVLGTPRRASPR